MFFGDQRDGSSGMRPSTFAARHFAQDLLRPFVSDVKNREPCIRIFRFVVTWFYLLNKFCYYCDDSSHPRGKENSSKHCFKSKVQTSNRIFLALILALLWGNLLCSETHSTFAVKDFVSKDLDPFEDTGLFQKAHTHSRI